MEEIAPGVFAETGHTGCNNACIVTDGGIVLVDPPMCPSQAVSWRERTSGLGELKFVINTEHHWDHIGGNCFYPEARVVSHTLTRTGAVDGMEAFEFWRDRMKTLDPEGADLLGDYQVRLAELTYEQTLTLHLGGREIRLIHKPGHTEGQTLVYLPDARALLPGDNVLWDWPPLLESGVGGAWLACLDFIETLDLAVIVPGHGQVCGKEALPPLRKDLRELMDRVRECVGEGMSEEETRGRVRYDRRWKSVPDSFHKRFELFYDLGVARLYRELGG